MGQRLIFASSPMLAGRRFCWKMKMPSSLLRSDNSTLVWKSWPLMAAVAVVSVGVAGGGAAACSAEASCGCGSATAGGAGGAEFSAAGFLRQPPSIATQIGRMARLRITTGFIERFCFQKGGQPGWSMWKVQPHLRAEARSDSHCTSPIEVLTPGVSAGGKGYRTGATNPASVQRWISVWPSTNEKELAPLW